MALFLSSAVNAQNPSASISQGKNGNYSNPTNPVDWVTGNLNQQQSHMMAGYSVPYRLVMANLVIGVPIEIEFQYDTKTSGLHAIDFITYYDNLEPHSPWGHAAETINPLQGYPLVPTTPVYATIPTPTQGVLVNGILEPQTTFNSLLTSMKRMTLWGGTFALINPVTYSFEDPIGPTTTSTSTTVMVRFTPTSTTAILAWGGHISTALSFGAGTAAGSISGSPYHTRVVDWNLGNLGQQDLALSAAAVALTPE